LRFSSSVVQLSSLFFFQVSPDVTCGALSTTSFCSVLDSDYDQSIYHNSVFNRRSMARHRRCRRHPYWLDVYEILPRTGDIVISMNDPPCDGPATSCQFTSLLGPPDMSSVFLLLDKTMNTERVWPPSGRSPVALYQCVL